MTTDTKPTDAEIVELMRDGYNCRYNDEADHVDFARAVLDKWGRPAAVAGEPVAWLDPWTGAKVTTDYDAYGKHGIPLYTAPQPVEREPLTHAQAKALVLKYGNDPLHLVLQVERAHGIKGGQHGD